MRRVDLDRHVASRVRGRRIAMGLSQARLAASIGIGYQQLNKYETGVDRIAAGRLFSIARALGVEVAFFYRDIELQLDGTPPRQEALHQGSRRLSYLTSSFLRIANPRHREAVCRLARALADSSDVDGDKA